MIVTGKNKNKSTAFFFAHLNNNLASSKASDDHYIGLSVSVKIKRNKFMVTFDEFKSGLVCINSIQFKFILCLASQTLGWCYSK